MKTLLFNREFKNIELGDGKEIISIEGIRAINKWLQEHGYEMNDWSREWVVTVGGNKGTFPKRIARWQKKYVRGMTDEEISELGNLARRYIIGSGIYDVFIDNKLDWEPGTFGDYGSCFWQSRSLARKMLKDNGAASIKIYDTATQQPVSRCWIAPIDRRVIIFNCYSHNNLFSINTVANLLTTILPDTTSTKIKLVNWKYGSEGTLFINGELGIIIHSESDTIQEDVVDLQWDDPIHKIRKCDECGEYTYEKIFSHTRYNTLCCPECINNLYVVCDICNNFVKREHATYVNGSYYARDLYEQRVKEIETGRVSSIKYVGSITGEWDLFKTAPEVIRPRRFMNDFVREEDLEYYEGEDDLFS